jgi:hypothetical protein
MQVYWVVRALIDGELPAVVQLAETALLGRERWRRIRRGGALVRAGLVVIEGGVDDIHRGGTGWLGSTAVGQLKEAAGRSERRGSLFIDCSATV